MTVIRPNSVSGITSITAQANEINFFRSNGTLAGLQLNGVNFNTTTGVSTFNNLDVGGVLTYQDVTNVDSVGIITARSTIDAQGAINLADSIIHTGDTNTKIRFPSADTITFETAGSERLRILSSGNVGIGTDNPQYLDANFRELTISGGSEGAGLHLQDDNANVVGGFFTSDNTNAMIIRTRSNHPMIFRTNNTERLRITSTGLIYVMGDGTGGRIDATAGDGSMTFSDGNGRQTFKIQTMASGQSATHTFNASGYLGIGIASPQALTHIYDDTDTSAVTEQLRISGGDRSADTFETGFRFFTQSPSANGNRHYRFIANGNTGLTIQGYETSSGNAGSDRKILLNPDGGDVGVGTDRDGRQVWRTGRTLEIGSAGGNDVAQLFLASNRGDGEQTVGSIVFADNTQNSSKHNLAIIECDKKGSTANNRGGSLIFLTKSDGSDAPDNAWMMSAGGAYGTSLTDYSTLRHMKGVTSYTSAYNTGDIYIHIEGLYNLPGNAWWYTQILLQSTEIVGTQAGSHHYLTSLTLMGIAQWNSVGVNNVIGSASVSITASTATSVTLFINVNDSSRGPITVWASNTAGQDGPYISFS